MRKTILSLLLLLPLFSYSQVYKKLMQNNTSSISEIQESARKYFLIKGTGKGTGYKQYKRWEYNAKRMQSENGEIRSSHFFSKEYAKYNATLNKRSRQIQSSQGKWEALGPTNWTATSGYNPGIGRVTSIAIDKNDDKKIIIGSQTGGVWKSTNKGESWVSLSDQFSTMNVYSLAIHPTEPNSFFWGSTDGNIYKSINSGSTWSLLGTLNNGNVNKIIINPNTPNIMFATVSGSGVFKSINEGASWIKVSTEESGVDIEFQPGNPNIIYASGFGFHKSIDGGTVWTKVSTGFGGGLKMIGVSPANKETVYVIEEESGIFGGLYVSTNSGFSFVKKTHTNKNYFGYSTSADDDSGQAPRDMGIAVSTTNINEVHIAGINTWRSLDGGTTFLPSSDWTPEGARFANLGYCHADVDDLLYHGSELYVISDGGVYVAENPGGTISPTFYTDKSTGLGIHQFYKIGVSQTSPVVISGGAQDNGTSAYVNNVWKNWCGADGMESFVDKTDTTILYGTQQSGGLVKSIDGGDTYDNIGKPDDTESGNWVTPFEQDPIAVNTIYAAFESVHKSEDGGGTWSSISQKFDSSINHLKIASSNNQIIYTAFSDQLYKTTTGGGVWIRLTGFLGSINSISIHPKDANKVAISTTSNNKVYVSTDGGGTWVAKKTGLPNLAALAIVWDDNGKDGLYVGMNYGVYYIDNTLSSWQPFSNLLPNVMINELEINTVDKKLYVATYGRGVWATPVHGSSVLSVDDISLLEKIKIFPNPATSFVQIQWNESNKSEVRLFNLNGQMIYLKKGVSLTDYKIDVRALPSGMYFLRINSKKGVFTKKVIIKTKSN